MLQIFLALFALLAACTSGPSAPRTIRATQRRSTTLAPKRTAFRRRPRDDSRRKRTKCCRCATYPLDPAFRVPAALQLSKDRPVFDMPTSTGTIRKMQRVGVLEFTLKGDR